MKKESEDKKKRDTWTYYKYALELFWDHEKFSYNNLVSQYITNTKKTYVLNLQKETCLK